MFTLSAPGPSPPPPSRNTHGTSSDIHQDIANVHRDVVNPNDVVYWMLNSQEGTSGQDWSVGVACAPSIAEETLITT